MLRDVLSKVNRRFRIARERFAARKIRRENGVVVGFAPWVTRDGITDLEKILTNIHALLYRGYGPDMASGGQGVDKIQSSDISEYDDLLRRLKCIDGLTPATMADLCLRRERLKGTPIALWHDVDSDIETALKMARLEAEHGFRGTYYIHYCSLYYGDFYRRSLTNESRLAFDRFERNVNVGEIYREIQALGHEIGFHFNPYGVFRQKHMDGVQAMETELAWMRGIGLNIRGGAGHSSYNRQGADPYEIFSELADDFTHIYEGARHLRRSFEFDNVRMPRLAISHKDLDLEYVADFILRQSQFEFWAKAGLERYRTGNPGSLQFNEPRLSTTIDAVACVERSMDGNARWIIFNSHPAHYGQRAHPDRGCEAQARASGVEHRESSRLRRLAYAPNRLQVTRYTAPSGCLRTVLVHSDSEGFIDYPQGTEKDSGRPSWLLLGGSLIDCPHLALAAQPQGYLRDLSRRAGWPVAAHKRALFNSSISDLERYLQTFELDIDYLAVFIGADALLNPPIDGDPDALLAWCQRFSAIAQSRAKRCAILVGDIGRPAQQMEVTDAQLGVLEVVYERLAAIAATNCEVTRLQAVLDNRPAPRNTAYGLDAHDAVNIAKYLLSANEISPVK